MKRGIPLVKIEAKDNYEFGFKLGKALKKEIQYRLEKNKEIYKKKAYHAEDFSKLVNKAKKFLPAIKRHFPQLLIEAKAMAEGAEVPFEELFVLICEEQIVDYKILHCTSVAIRTDDNKILHGNNEDWIPEYTKNGLVLIRGKIKNTRFLCLSYIGNMAGSSAGLNSYGLSYTDNSFVLRKFTYDVPRSFHLRALLEAKNPKNAIKILNTKGSIGSNTTLVFSNKSITCVEELWNREEILGSKDFIIHTNHPLLLKDRTKINTPKESLIRYERAKEILLKEKNPNIKTLKRIFRDHKAKICEHHKRKNTPMSVSTIASIIMNPKDKWMMVCHKNPCNNKYKKYYLN